MADAIIHTITGAEFLIINCRVEKDWVRGDFRQFINYTDEEEDMNDDVIRRLITGYTPDDDRAVASINGTTVLWLTQ